MMRLKGQQQELAARDYLVNHGLKLIQQNFTSRFGEIDLIMEDHGTLCFIEVKHRSSSSHGGASAAITSSKQRKIIKTAEYFLCCHPAYRTKTMRFDGVLLETVQGAQQINWIKGAFYAS